MNLKLAAGFACCALSFAGTTRTWLQSDYADFEKGNVKGLSVRSDGRLTLAPQSKELFDASSAYLWTLARDSKGNLYTGGGPGAKLFVIRPDGKHQKLAEFDALEIHAIAVDAKDQIYVGTAPDGKVYKVSPGGQTQEFYNPKQKYIWAMAFGPAGDLFVATGDAGEVHRVDPSGKGQVFFKSDETHARSLVVDAQGNLIVGTEPGGLVIRISPRGEGFVLYQMSKREITALAAGPDGSVYAAGSGVQTPQPAVTPPPPPPPTAAASGDSHGLTPAAAAGMSARVAMPSGGADVYRIHPGGRPEKVWTNGKDTVYSITFDPQGHVLLGAGNKGTLYRVDTNTLYTALLNVASSQITAIVTGANGTLYAAASNVGKVFRFGPDLQPEGSIESDVFDAGGFAQWGRVKYEGTGKIALTSRSGNLDRPQKNWSAWSKPMTAITGERLPVPPARFLQWKATLSGGPQAHLDSVEAAYLTQNVAPQIEEIEITPPNYKFTTSPALLIAATTATNISLPAIGKRPPPSSPGSADLSGNSMQYAKGWLGARWTATDENADTLAFTVEIRGVGEKGWKPLAEKLKDRHFTFDSTAFPDGEYRLRITASDFPSNPQDEALTVQQESSPFFIDNTPPEISGLVWKGGTARWKAADALNIVKKAEYSLDGGEWTVVNPVTKLSDSLSLDYSLALPGLTGEHTLAVRVTDDYENQALGKVVSR